MIVRGELTITCLETGEEQRICNLVTSGGLALVRDYLLGNGPKPPLYVAYGSGIETPSQFMHQLPGETFRSPIVSRQKDGASVVYSWFVKDSDNQNETVGIYGLVAGAATPASGTGVLFSAASEPVPFSKSPSKSYSGDWRITVSGVSD